jgi:O-antigen/teichoic acid export membrane protein
MPTQSTLNRCQRETEPVKNIHSSLIFSFAERYSCLFVNVLSTIILARLLSPAETGLYSVAAGLVNIAQALREFGVSNYILQVEEQTREKIALVTGICLSIATVLAVIFWISADAIASFYGNPGLSLIIEILSANFIVVAFASISSAQLKREMNFRIIMYVTLSGNIANALISVGLSALDFGAVSLAWGSLGNVVVTLGGNYLALGPRSLVWPTLRNWRQLMLFGVYSSGATLLLEVVERAPDLVVGRLVSLEGTGLFSRGNGLVTLFNAALVSAVDPVISSGLATLHRDRQDAREPLLRIFSYLSAIGWPILSILGLLAYPIIVIMFGRQWIAAVGVAQILCLSAALSLIGNVCQTYQAATGAVRANFWVQIVSVPIFVLGVAFGALHSLEGAAIGATAAGGIMTLISLLTLQRRIHLTWAAISRSVLPSLAITGLTSLPAVALIEMVGVEHVWAISFMGGGGGVLAWLAGVFLVRHPLRFEVRLAASFIRRKFHLPGI